MKSNPKLVSLLIGLWLVSFARLLHAAAGTLPPFSQDFRGFDFESLMLAAGAGLIGGAGRTIYSLATERVLVGNLWREALKDAALALIGGVVAWAVLTVAANFFPTHITSGVRMVGIVLAGASRGKWANVLGDTISGLLGGLKSRIAVWAGGGNTPPPVDPPPSAVTPLESPK